MPADIPTSILGILVGILIKLGGGFSKSPPLFEARDISFGVNQLTNDVSRVF